MEGARVTAELIDAPFGEIARGSGVRARSDVTGREVTTVAAGGALRALFEPESRTDLERLLRAMSSVGVVPRILGAGSNLLIDDGGVRDAVVRLGSGFRETASIEETLIEVGAGCGLMRISRNLSAAGFSGLEFASGIPASVGGAVRMNAGAHGGQIADVVESVECVDLAGNFFRLTSAELGFGYRRSSLPAGAMVVSARFRLTQGDRAAIEQRRAELLAYRKATQPLTLPSFGSVFKNPSAERSAGAIIEGAGLKGRRIGGAEISSLHANWIVNRERTATVGEIRQLIELCRREASQRGEPSLEPEVVLWMGP